MEYPSSVADIRKPWGFDMDLTLFAYRPGHGILYRLPAWVKLLCLIPLSVVLFQLDILPSCICIILFILGAGISGFSVKQQFQDIKPVLIYVYILYGVAILTNLIKATGSPALSPAVFIPGKNIILQILHLCTVLQAASLVFNTTTSLQLRDGLTCIEESIRRCLRAFPGLKKHIQSEAVYAGTISLLVNFIPAVFIIWNRLDRAWNARNGKNGIRKMQSLIPAFFVLCMLEADKTYAALKNRRAIVN